MEQKETQVNWRSREGSCFLHTWDQGTGLVGGSAFLQAKKHRCDSPFSKTLQRQQEQRWLQGSDCSPKARNSCCLTCISQGNPSLSVSGVTEYFCLCHFIAVLMLRLI